MGWRRNDDTSQNRWNIETTNLAFEFDNTSADSGSKIGTSDASISGLTNGDFVATVTYFDGSETINVGDSGGGAIGSSVFSGLNGSGKLYGGQDGNVVTIHSQSGNTGASAYEFDGDFYRCWQLVLIQPTLPL